MNQVFKYIKSLNIEEQMTLAISILAIILYLLFIGLDFVVYPAFVYEIFWIRFAVVLWTILITSLYVLKRINSIFTYIFIFPLAFGISLMCYITNDGFSSIYFVGIFLVIIAATLFKRTNPKPYALLMTSVALQHFILQWFIPFTVKDLIINLFFLVSAIILSVLINYAFNKMTDEIKTLEELLPICSQCKKIRDDEGYWHQVDSYINSKTGVQFSHSLCSECIKELYPEFV